VNGDQVQFANGNAVLGSSRFLPSEGYVLADKRLQVGAAGRDLESLAGVVFQNRVVAIRASQATFNVDRVCIAARSGSLCKPHCDQQCRYNEQEYSLHGILREVPPCGGANSAWV
jgi:hypothetical protein